jgi:hypothetical protein
MNDRFLLLPLRSESVKMVTFRHNIEGFERSIAAAFYDVQNVSVQAMA